MQARLTESGDPWSAAADLDLRLATLLGSGRHGMVFRCSQQMGAVARDIALKVPCRPGALDHEATTIARFSHPHIVRMIGAPLSNGALVLEHCDQGSLSLRLDRTAMSIDDLVDVVIPICDALQYLHETGWIHGDVSPGNIGLRSVAGPVLFDFATARPSDGSPVEEGTAQFAGPLRLAEPRLDVRCLAATALYALGRPDRWDRSKNHVREALRTFIANCDASIDGGLAELTLILENGRQLPDRCTATATSVPTGSGRSVTRPFGPRPVGPEPDTSNDDSTRLRRSIIAIALLAALIVAIVGGESGGQSWSLEVPAEQLRMHHPLTASESVENHGARWNTVTGVMSRSSREGRTEHFGVGQPGDVAAIADWSCDRQPTIGVYRPSSGAWFEFDSWDEDARSTAPAMLTPMAELFVQVDSAGCATPLVR